jgi:hypothetical protein
MELHEKASRPPAEFRLAPPSKRKVLAGAASVVAVGSFAFLVFGHLADQRTLALAGLAEARPTEAPVAPSAARTEAKLARRVSREAEVPL